jgi:hypothetical protein
MKRVDEENKAAEDRLAAFWKSLKPDDQKRIAPILNDLKMTSWGMNVLPHNENMEIDPTYKPPAGV